MKDKKIYIDNIPKFEEYDLIDLNEDDSLFLMKMYDEENENQISQGTRLPDGIYIKGKNIQDNDVCIDADTFFNDYLKLGRDIFNLSTSKKDIEFQYPYKLDDEYIYLKHVASDLEYEIKMREKYNCDLDEIYTIKEEASAYLEDTIFEGYLGIFQDLTDKTLNIIYIMHVAFNQDVQEKIERLINVMSGISECCILANTDNSKKIFSRLENINRYLQILLNDLKKEIENKNLNIRKKSVTSNAKKLDNITNIDFINKINDYPIKIRFTYNQFKDLKKIIKSWLNKYGFPYYVEVDDEDNYKVEIEKIISLNEDEMIIPCDILIIHSVYNYMLYSILSKGNKADEIIKEKFMFFNEKHLRKNKNNIFTIKKDFSYYNNVVCSDILNFKSNYISYDIEKEEFQNSDNYFKKKIADEVYEEKLFNNLCIAFNFMLDNETRYASPSSKERKCSICGKWFVPNKNHRTYCSKKCSKNGNKEKNKENKRKHKNKKDT